MVICVCIEFYWIERYIFGEFGSSKFIEEGLIYLWCDFVFRMLFMCVNYGLDDLI